ncbi:MAG: carbohydrate ABC transporter permease [bacterium]
MKRSQIQKTLIGYSFLAPSLILIFTFVLYPIGWSIYISLCDWPSFGTPTYIGFENYINLLRDSRWWRSLTHSIYFMANIPLSIILAMLIAIIMNQSLKGITIFRTLYYLPVISPSIAVALVWALIYNTDFGILNYFLSLLGINGPRWLASTKWAMPAVILYSIWKGLGYNMVIYLAGLQGIPETLYEAAKIDGANSWILFRYITLPMLSPTTFFLMVMGIIGGFRVFDVIYVMTKGGPGDATVTPLYYLYQQAFQWFRMGYASSIAWLLFIFVFSATLVQWYIRKSWVFGE